MISPPLTRRQWLEAALLGVAASAPAESVPAELLHPVKTKVPITGIGQDRVLERHDPSNVIRHQGKYYLWYTEHRPGVAFIDTYIQWATSPDGYHWQVHGTALEKGKPGSVYNICTGKSYSIREILDMLIRISGVEVEVRTDRGRLRPSDVPLLEGDNSLFAGDTGWKPEISMEQTLSDLLDFWRNNPNRR